MLVPIEKIEEAKSKLGEKAAVIIAEDLKLKEFDEYNLKSLCPFHSEDSGSFIWNSKNNSYHCFGCSSNWDIINHYMSFYRLTYLGAVEKLFSETGIKHRFGERFIKTDRDYRYPKHEDNDRSKTEKYLETRGLSKETLDYLDIGSDENGNVALHYYDSNDVLSVVKYRPSRKVVKKENKFWSQQGADTKNILFNMNRIDPTKPLIITEGELDCASVIESGYYNCVSIPFGAGNTRFIEECYDWLEQFQKIICFFDNDPQGTNLRKETCARIGSWRTYYIDIPFDIEKEDGVKVPVKDANDILVNFGKQKVLDFIDSAQEIPVQNVVDLYDVNEFNLENAPGFYSSIDELNTYIYKYILGTVCVLTGRNGNGKSVFLNQEFIAEPINQGLDVFVFSAEMSHPILKNWIELVLAGREKVKLENNTIHKIDPDAKRQMRDWYKGRIFVYDNDKDYTADAIMDRLETVVRRYGVKVAVIDNLLTVDLQCDQENLYKKQKEFMVRLINFAAKYGVFITLISHPKKTEMFRRLTSDDVGGSGAQTNLAHYVMSVHRYSKAEKDGEMDAKGKGYKKGKEPIEYDCVIDLFKNRIAGHANKEIQLYFDYQSYRFYQTAKQLWKRYGWSKDTSPLPKSIPNKINQPEFMDGNDE